MKTKELKRNKGITLIALVITIIVLLILAAVSIATLTGENGILTRASDAKEKTEQAKENELRQLTAIEAATYLEEHEYEDPSGKTITIPAQCAVSQVEGENTLEDGLVIIDKNGNEWVWIEVLKSLTQDATTDEDIKNVLIRYAGEYRGSFSDTWYDSNGQEYNGTNGTDNGGCGLTYDAYQQKYSEMLQSIKANGGFYIGRYEVGSFDNPVTVNNNTRTARIQEGAYPYNYVKCSQAEELAEELAIEDKTSSLMFGIQWDLVLKYLELNGDWNTTTQDASYYLINNSSSWGNYRDVSFSVEEGNKYAIATNWVLGQWNDVTVNYPKPTFDSDGNGVLLSTGATERNSKMNIYDFAGNVWEWTLEKSTDTISPCSIRGGNCNSAGSRYPVSNRYGTTSTNNYDIGFRSALY